MRRALKIGAIALAVLIAIPLVLLAVILYGANTGAGRALIARETASLSGGQVRISGLGGRFPQAIRLGHAELADKGGVYATIDGLVLDWSPRRLLAGEVSVERLAARRIHLTRLPQATGGGGSRGFRLPLAVRVQEIAVPRIELDAPVAGTPIALGLSGNLALTSMQQGTADLRLTSLAGDAQYQIAGRFDPAHISAAISIHEPGPGLLTGLVGLPGLEPLAVNATLEGPRSAVAVRLALTAGLLSAGAEGTVDLVGRAADLAVTADAPAMSPAADLSWRAVHLALQVQGPFTRPHASGTLAVDALSAWGAAARSIHADLQGDQGEVQLRAALEGLNVPGPRPDLFAAAPVVLDATARLDTPERPLTFSLSHPLLSATGEAETGTPMTTKATVHLPDLAPLATALGTDLAGHADVRLDASRRGAATNATIDADLAVTGGMAPLPALIGDGGHLAAVATLQGNDLTLDHLSLDGKAIAATARGSSIGGKIGADWTVRLADLAALAPGLGGSLQARGNLTGTADDLATEADISAEIAGAGLPRGPLSAQVSLAHLPARPTGHVSAQGELAGSPLTLDVTATRGADGTMRAEIAKADWKSAHAAGTLALPAGAAFPVGSLDLRVGALDDFRPFVGQPLSGSITAALATETQEGRQRAHLTAQARDAGLPGSLRVTRGDLDATVTDPTGRPSLSATLALDGLDAAGVTGSARLTANGPQDALATRLSANLQNLAGAPAVLNAASVIDATRRSAAISQLTADYKGQTLRLLAPVRVGFADAITLDRLRLGQGQASAEIAGRLSPSLNLTAALRNVTPDLVKPFAPDIDAEGTLSADATLTGTPARPTGTVRLTANALRMRTGPGRALPPANLTARADLAGTSAQLDLRLAAGRLATIAVTGSAPVSTTGPLNLRSTGQLDLTLLDPILTPAGRRARGRLALDATIAGTPLSPRLGGSAQLSGGDVRDDAQGVHISAIAANLALEGQSIRITQFTGRAGSGTIALAGTVGILAPNQPVDLTLTAVNARPIASPLLTADLDANLTLRGQLASRLMAGGAVRIRRAEIDIPEKMPPSIAVLNVRRPGAPPPPPPAPGMAVGLDLTLSAPAAIFVRGRGVFAELGGTVQVHGSTLKPEPLGSFKLRRGSFSIAGQTLAFNRGEVSFTGGSLTDPSLDFLASASSGTVTANLAITGTASAPKITLSSTPDLPQDEVLAQLLFRRSTSSLSPFELAEIAATLAQLTGTGPNIGNPLERLRKDLGLDTLSVGSGSGGNPTLQAGRYVSRRVFVGARQGTGGNSTQGLVQVDLARGLRLEGTVGTGQNTNPGATPADSGGSSIGLTYQFEY